MADKKPLKEALEKVKTALCDLTSLEVQTYTGNLDVVIDKDIQTITFDDILADVKMSGNLKLVAVTKVEFDGDARLLIPESPLPDHVNDAHASALKAGQETRAGIISLFSNVIGLKTSK